jgi:hypothetical protein
MKTYTRKSTFSELKPYDHLAKEHDFMEVTEWYNGEGFDVTINERHFSMTYGEFECLQVLAKYRAE